MKIPDAIVTTIETLEDDKMRRLGRQHALDQEIKELRGRWLAEQPSPTPEILAQGEIVTEWLRQFGKTREHDRIFGLIGEYATLPLFKTRFWKGQPVGDDPEAEAVFAITSNGSFNYAERRGDLRGHSHQANCSPQSLAYWLHPVFLKKLVAHLQGDNAFALVAEMLDGLTAKRNT